MKNVWIVIPARKGSKGFPFKNRHLFDYTAKQVPDFLRQRTIVTTDDDQLLARATEYEFNILKRNIELAADDTSMKMVIKDVIKKFKIHHEDDIIILYLTYPQRLFKQIQKIYNYFIEMNSFSLLCKKNVDSHPYMCYYMIDEHKGTKVINHDLYRRQDYPKCFEVSHYVVILKAKILDKLDNNLYHPNTLFYSIDGKIFDVDYLSDFEGFQRTNKLINKNKG